MVGQQRASALISITLHWKVRGPLDPATCAGLSLTSTAQLHQPRPPLHLSQVGRPGSTLALVRFCLLRREPSLSNPDARRSPRIRRSFQLNLSALPLRTQPRYPKGHRRHTVVRASRHDLAGDARGGRSLCEQGRGEAAG